MHAVTRGSFALVQMKLNVRAVEISAPHLTAPEVHRCRSPAQESPPPAQTINDTMHLIIYQIIIIMKDIAPETLLMQANYKLRNDVRDARAVRVRLLKSRRKYNYDKYLDGWMP